MPHPISPALLFRSGAEPAAKFYLSLFPHASITAEHRGEDGSHIATTLNIAGQELLLISGGPECQFSVATSLMIYCDTQEEIDTYWAKLSDGGEVLACGWINDRFGVSWQVTPRQYQEWVTTGTPAQAKAAFETLIQMTKIEITPIQEAWEAAR